jgi:uncharacterized protein
MNYISLAFVAAFFYMIDLYVFKGIKVFALSLESAEAQFWTIRLYWVINNAFYALVAAALLTLDRNKGMQLLQKITFNTFVALIIPKLIFVAIMLGQDAFRVLEGLFNSLLGKETATFLPSRRVFVSKIALAAAAIPFGAIVYGIFKGKYDYRVHKHTIFFKDLPDAFDGFTITQLSDIHAGSFDNPEAVKRGVALANAQQSDLLVFTGDLVNNEAKEIEPYIDIFKVLDAPFGKFSILGNHDYGDYKAWSSKAEKQANFTQLLTNHKALGFRLLLNENLTIEKNGQKITLIGVENWGQGFAQHGDLEKAMENVEKDSFKVLLSHDPTHWEKQVKPLEEHIHLTLSGHTHGAQMGVEIGSFKWSPIKFRYPKWAGLYEEAGKYLHINRGFGFLGFSGRVGILPEITVLELKKMKI